MRTRLLYGGFPAGLLSIAVAFIAAGALASCAQEVKVTAPRSALSIGIQNYKYVSSLSYTLSDATAMATILSGQGWSTTSLMDDQATRQGIIDALHTLAAQVTADSTVLIYYSGHGDTTNDGSSGLIAPVDTKLINSYTIDESTTISAMQFAAILATFPTQRIVVIFDSCNSGNFVNSGSSIDASPQDYSSMKNYSAFSTAMASFGDLLAKNASASGRQAPIVLSAAGTQESSYDGTNGWGGTIVMNHGVFTYYLLDAAINGDTNRDGIVTTTEAYAYTEAKIKAWYLGLSDAAIAHFGYSAFLPHISGGARDLVLFTQ